VEEGDEPVGSDTGSTSSDEDSRIRPQRKYVRDSQTGRFSTEAAAGTSAQQPPAQHSDDDTSESGSTDSPADTDVSAATHAHADPTDTLQMGDIVPQGVLLANGFDSLEEVPGSDMLVDYLQSLHLGEAEEEEADDPDFSLGGPVPIHKKWPQAVAFVKSLIESSDFGAQERRRTDVGQMMGCSVQWLRDQVRAKFPEILEAGYKLHANTIRRWPHPPRLNASCASRHFCLIAARLHRSKIQTDLTSERPNSHACAAQYGNSQELAIHCGPAEVAHFSGDVKNLLPIGYTTAVSRYHNINRVFSLGKAPQKESHDFVLPGYTLQICGWLHLTSEVKEYQDDLGRVRIQRPRGGTLYMSIRSKKFRAANAATHFGDLYRGPVRICTPNPKPLKTCRSWSE